MSSPLQIRPLREADWPSVRAMLQATFAAGETYAFERDCTELDIRRAWIDAPAATFVACIEAGPIVGSYFIKANQLGPGSHVCNCGYVVARPSEGQGIAAAMCEHSQQLALEMGFQAMQFNLVVSTNARAVRLWQQLGFAIVGTLPGAFRHARLGYVDAFVMFKQLGEPQTDVAADQPRRADPLLPNVELLGARIRLRPLKATDAAALVAAATDGDLWKLPFTVVPSAQTVNDYIDRALAGRAAGTVLPFAIEQRQTNQVIGSTRFWKIDRANRKLEIGSSWLAASWQKSYANTEAKALLLAYAFDQLGCVRVQFTTDVTNEKSRAAILRLGATLEGVVRRERIMPDGRQRDSQRFSIIEDEWPAVRDRLTERLARS